MSKKHKSILDRVKQEARLAYDEGKIQAHKAAEAQAQPTMVGGMSLLWRNFMNTVDQAMKDYRKLKSKKGGK